jgi:hypothetical protein
VVLENSRVKVGILVSRGAEIVEFRFKPLDMDVLWHTDRALPSPGYFPQTAQEVDTFFDHFVGGWQESFPTGNSVGSFRGARLALHGEVSLQPWDYDVVRDSAGGVEVEFRVACRRTPFELTRRMSLEGDSAVVRFEEQISNRAGVTLEYAWGHHPSFGPPFLTPQCVLDLPPGTYRTPPAASPKARSRFLPEQESRSFRLRGTNGQVIDARSAPPERGGTMGNFCIELRGPGRASLRNPTVDLGIGFVWDSRVFRYLWQWEVSHGCPDYPLWGREYLVALEPFNCPIGGLPGFAGQNVLPKLKANASLTTRMDVGFCRGNRAFNGKFL